MIAKQVVWLALFPLLVGASVLVADPTGSGRVQAFVAGGFSLLAGLIVLVGPFAIGDAQPSAQSLASLDPSPLPAETVTVTGVTERDCWDPHESQALMVIQLQVDPNTRYPGAQAASDALAPTCEGARDRVMGTEPGPEWAFATLYPSPESWASGDRQGVCQVSREDGSLLDAPLTDQPQGSAG